MRVILTGADFEENLGVGMIAAAAEAAGHDVRIVPFNERSEARALARQIAAETPDMVGLSIQFQHRAFEFLALSRMLRAEGYMGHVTCGGQFPTLAWRECLSEQHGIDSIVLHEGEETFADLLTAMQAGTRLGQVPGLAILSDDGAPMRTEGRALGDLNALPFPKRYRPHAMHMGVPFIPIMGGRGCWGRCRFCSITTFYRDARAHGGGRTLRHRTPDNIAQEMAILAGAAGGTGIFCFHDDNFLLPRTKDSLARVRAIREAFDGYGLGKIGLIGKCRPDTLDRELAVGLAEQGLIRMYVGVENASEAGAAHLRRGTQTDAVRAALAACREANIFSCYNLLLFEPEASVDDIRVNVEFMREHATHPINFCRAEPYYATPLHRDMAAAGRLGGSYLGYNYRIADDQTELLFRVASAAFRERNFSCHGVANRYMSLGYTAKLLEHFYEDPHGRAAELKRRATALTRKITLETADFLEQAIDIVDKRPSEDQVARATALLGLQISASDHRLHVLIDDLSREMQAFTDGAYKPPAPAPSDRMRKLAQSVALGTSLAIWAAGAEACSSSHRRPGPVVDPVPADAGVDADGAVNPDTSCCWADPLPADSSVVTPPDVTVVDIAPYDAGIADPPPYDAGIADPVPPDAGADTTVWPELAPPESPVPSASLDGVRGQGQDPVALIDQWRDTTTKRAVRSTDLALSNPPQIELSVERQGSDGVRVRVEGGPASLTYRWHSNGEIAGEGREVHWIPEGPDDHLRVAVRAEGGVAIVSVRARNVPETDRG